MKISIHYYYEGLLCTAWLCQKNLAKLNLIQTLSLHAKKNGAETKDAEFIGVELEFLRQMFFPASEDRCFLTDYANLNKLSSSQISFLFLFTFMVMKQEN